MGKELEDGAEQDAAEVEESMCSVLVFMRRADHCAYIVKFVLFVAEPLDSSSQKGVCNSKLGTGQVVDLSPKPSQQT